MRLFKLSLYFSLFIFLHNSLTGQTIEGKFYLPTTGLHLSFMPPSGNDQYGIYQADYATGQSGQQYYSQWGNQITLAQFNNGIDESFIIEQYDGHQLVLVSSLNNYRYVLTKVNQQAPVSNTASGNILAALDGHNFYESDFQKLRKFVEFVLGTTLSNSEHQKLRSEAIIDFKEAPQQSLQLVTDVDQQMTRLYQLTDVAQIAIARSTLLSQIVTTYQTNGETDYFLDLISLYTPILAIDPSANLVFTQKDFDGYINLINFYASLARQNLDLNQNTRQQYLKQLISYFKNGDLSTKQSLATIGLVSEFTINYYQQLRPEQQQNYVASLYNTNVYNSSATSSYTQPDYSDPNYIDSLWPEGVTTKAQKQAYLAKRQSEIDSNNYMFNAMQNMQNQSHVTSLNIIENMGDSGNYWEIKDY